MTDDEIGFDLAKDLKLELLDRVPQPTGPVLLHCCCWLLADVITQAAEEADTPVEKALALVMVTLTDTVARLTLANDTAEADAAATKH